MANVRDLTYQKNNLLIDRDLLLSDIKTQELRAQANLPGAATEVAKLKKQLAVVDSEIATINQQIKLAQSSTSAGTIVKDDQAAQGNRANEVNPKGGVEILENGRIKTAPDTTAGSNANKFDPTKINDFGTDGELRPYIKTQGTTPGSNQISPGLQRTDIVKPGGNPGVGARRDDGGSSSPIVSSLNSINFAEKIIPEPNVLDQYASYTYTASLYLMTKANIQKLLNTGTRDVSGAKLLIQSGGISQNNRSEYFDLDYYIDDIEIHSIIVGQGSRAAHNVTDVRIKVIEPNGISFVENLSNACQSFVNNSSAMSYDSFGNPVPAGSASATTAGAKNIGKTLPYTSQPYLLVIRFYGYDDQGNLVRGGKSPNTTDPNSFVEKFYPLVIEKFGFRIANKAAEYDIKFKAPQYQLNGGQARASLPFNFEFSGGTVNDVLAGPASYGVNQPATNGAPANASAIIPNKKTVRQGLMAALNEYQQELKKAGKIEFADEFDIEFALPAMASASIVLPGVNKSTTSMSAGGTASDKKLPSKQSMDTKTQTKAATAGMQIVQFIDTVLRNSSYITDQQVVIIDNKTGNERPGPGVNLKNTAWYKIGFKAVPKMDEFDTIRNDYAYKMTYTISPYKITQMYSPFFKNPEFNGTHKSYKYWFTGQNTSVLNYEETLNNLFFIALTNQSQGTTSNINELLKQQPYTASGQASQGGQDRATEPGASAADSLYSPGDLKECNMTIVGDPAWLQQGEAFSIMKPTDPYYYQPFLADGTINFDSQQILFDVGFNTPKDYNLATGLIEPGISSNTDIYPTLSSNGIGAQTKISRIYIATHCISNFKQGKFTQQLKGILRTYNVPGSEQKAVVTRPTTAAQVAATNQSSAPKSPTFAETQRSTVTNPTPSSSLAKGTQQLLTPVTNGENLDDRTLRSTPIYIQARKGGANDAAALAAAKSASAAGTNNYSGTAIPGIRTPNQQIVKDQ